MPEWLRFRRETPRETTKLCWFIRPLSFKDRVAVSSCLTLYHTIFYVAILELNLQGMARQLLGGWGASEDQGRGKCFSPG